MTSNHGQMVEGLHQAGDTISADDQHNAIFVKDESGNYQYLELGDNNGLKVDVVSIDGVEVNVDIDQYIDGYTIVGGEKGTIMVGTDGTNLQHVKVNSDGELIVNIDHTVTVQATDFDIRDLTHVSDSVTIGDGTNLIDITASGEIQVILNDIGASQTTDLKVSLDGEIVGTQEIGEDHSYGTAAIAKAATATVESYSPSSGTERINQVVVSADGDTLWEVKIGPTGSEVTSHKFWTRPAMPTIVIPINKDIASTDTILIEATNEENQTGNMNCFATIHHE